VRAVQQEFLSFREEGELKHRGRKNHNQYFTPEFAIEKAFSLIPMEKVENIIDPAVGEGAFLKIASKVWCGANLFGVDIDPNIIADLSKSNLPNSLFICADSLSPKIWHNLPELQDALSSGGFDLVVGNPPFSSWFNRIKSPEILKEFCLSRKNGRMMRSQAIEILFLEIFIRLVRNKGFIIIVLPDGILSNPQYKYIREFILKETRVKNIISLPRNVFEATSAKTSILILQKKRIKELGYLARISDLAKSGVVNNTVEVSGKDLVNRMDYYYYHNSRGNSINELRRYGTLFRPLKDCIMF
jgi:type I restriction enzyme M protein